MSPSQGRRRSRDRALVLRRFRYSESSLVVHVMTRRHGRVALLARGAFRPRSRYFAVLDFFDELELEWTTGRAESLESLAEGTLGLRRRGVTRDLATYQAGLSLLELTHLGSQPGHAEPRLFDELSRALEALAARGDTGVGPAPDRTRIEFELAFLRLHGLAPALTDCAACGGAAAPVEGSSPARVHFSAGAGGRLCAACAEEARAAGRRVGTLPLDVLLTADRMSGPRRDEPGAEPSPPALERVRDFVERFLDYQLETRPRSHRRFLAEDNRNAPTAR